MATKNAFNAENLTINYTPDDNAAKVDGIRLSLEELTVIRRIRLLNLRERGKCVAYISGMFDAYNRIDNLKH